MPRRTLAYGTTGDFSAIRPDETDLFRFDFTVPANGSVASGAVIACTVALDSPFPDIGAASRVLKTSISGPVAIALVGTMVDGVVYTLTSSIQFADGRVLAISADVECSIEPLPTTTLTPAQFRQDFPAFASASAFSDEAIEFWLGVMTNQMPLDPNRWGSLLSLGQELYVAHMLTLERQNQLIARRGGAPLAVGPAASRSVGGVSVSYDLSAAYNNEAGFWNLSSYGQRYWYYLNQAGMGPLQVI